MSWYKKAQQRSIQVDQNEMKNFFNNFMNHTDGNPQFIRDKNGIVHLFIHGTPPQNNTVYFYIGNNEQFGNNPLGYVSQQDLGKWMESKGFSSGTNVIACYAGQAQGINSEFQNTGEIQTEIPVDTNNNPVGDTINII
jgi:hypothetical protein